MRAVARRLTAPATLAAALVAALLLPPHARALDPVTQVETRLVSLTVTPSRTTLVGGQLAAVTVVAHLVDPDPGGVPRRTYGIGDFLQATCPCVLLTGSPAAATYSPRRIVSLSLVSGTREAGVWRGTTYLGGGNTGTWRATGIIAGDLRDVTTQSGSWADLEAVVPDELRFRLSGRDWPVLSIRLPSRAVPAGTPYLVRGAATSSATHRPVPGLRLALKHGDCESVEMGGGIFVRWVTTDAHGRWSARVRLADRAWCVRFGETPGFLGAASAAQATGPVA
jgi:hypothetical protein